MKHVHVRMKDTGEIRHVPDYVAEHLISRQRATRHVTRDQDKELLEFVISRGVPEVHAVQTLAENRAKVVADFEEFKAGIPDAEGEVETAMESPAADQATEQAVTPAQDSPARRPSRRRKP